MSHKPIKSSRFKSFDYNPITKRMEVIFQNNGEKLTVVGIPQDKVEAFERDESPGRFWDQNIWGVYPVEKEA